MAAQVFAEKTGVFELPVGSKLTITTDGTAAVQRIFEFSKVEDAEIASGDVFGPYAAPMQINVLGITGTTTVAESVATAEIGAGGGAASFTDLTDAPMSITPNAVMVGNDSGDSLLMSDIITINENGVIEITEDGDAGIVISADGGGGFAVSADGEGGITLSAAGTAGVTIHSDSPSNDSGGVQIISNGPAGISISTHQSGEDEIDADYGSIQITAGNPEGIRISTAKLVVNNETAAASQSVLVAGVGTMVFTHGILTGFTPA